MNQLLIGLFGGFLIGVAVALFCVFKLNQWGSERNEHEES